MLVTANVGEHRERAQDWDTRWEGPDRGLITAWLVGQDRAKAEPSLAERALAGELPVLPFRGGVEKAIKSGAKMGHLLYVAMWQGLRGEPLAIDLTAELSMTCTRHGVPVLYTGDIAKLAASGVEQ